MGVKKVVAQGLVERGRLISVSLCDIKPISVVGCFFCVFRGGLNDIVTKLKY